MRPPHKVEIEVNPHACMDIQAHGIVACQDCPFNYRKSKNYPDICGPGREIKGLIRIGKYPRKGIPDKVEQYRREYPPKPIIPLSYPAPKRKNPLRAILESVLSWLGG